MAQQLAVVQETHDSLRIILEDNETFDLVVDRVFTDLDVNHNGTLDTVEFQAYIARCCSNMGIRDTPDIEQIRHVFQHLDLDNDNTVTRNEMSVFLRHLFKEQLKHCAEKLKVRSTQQPKGGGAAAGAGGAAGTAAAGAAGAVGGGLAGAGAKSAIMSALSRLS